MLGAKYRNCPERPQHGTDIGPRDWLTLAIGFINASIHPRALIEDVSEQIELTCHAFKF